MARIDFNLQFATSGQSIFGSGEPLNFTDDRFLGIDFDKSIIKDFTIPLPFVDDIDVNFSAFSNGKVGLQSTLNLSGGTVNATIPVNLFLDIPSEPVREGETFSLQSGFSFGKNTFSLPFFGDIDVGPFFITSSPNTSYNLDLIFDVAAGVDVDPGFEPRGFDKNETSNLINLNSASSARFVSSLVNLDASIPNVTTFGTEAPLGSNQLTSSGSDEFVSGSLDLDFIATSLFGLPPLEADVPFIDFTIPVPIPFVPDIAVKASFNYNLLDIEAAVALSLIQSFSLNSITLPALLILENGTTIPFNVGEEIKITVPNNVGQSLDINALIDFNALFSSETSLGLDFDLDFLIGKFGLVLPFIEDFSVGPLLKENVPLFEPSFKVFDNTFNLGGFNQAEISFSTPTVNGTDVTTVNGTDVTNTNDSGSGSLRQAILNANTILGENTINFVGPVFSDSEPDTIFLTSGQLDITDSVTIQGTSANNLTVSSNLTSRVFNATGSGIITNIDNITVSGGNANVGGGFLIGSGTTLNLTNSVISNNTARNGGGIGILNNGTVVLTSSTLTGNTAQFNGGGINSSGNLTVINSAIINNTAERNGGGGIIGGGNMTIINATISNNTAGNAGGGISYTSSTSQPEGGRLLVTNSTISRNIASDGGGVAAILIADATIRNTIIAENTDEDKSNQIRPDVSGNFGSTDSNLIGDAADSSGFVDRVNGNIVGTSSNPITPRLGDLQNNGGSTFTRMLFPDSRAINAGNNANILEGVTTDQRGLARIVGDKVDIGAFEVQSPMVVTSSNDDIVMGTPGKDFIDGMGGQDTLTGLAGDDTIDGGDGDDTLFGNEGDDTLLGGSGQDKLFGGSGNDILNGETGDNILEGGDGKDIFVLSLGGKNTILDFKDGQDLLQLTGGLNFNSLGILQQGNVTSITTQSNQPLAFLIGVNASLIGANDFIMS